MRTRAPTKTSEDDTNLQPGNTCSAKISAKNDTDLRKVEQMPRNKPVENDMRTKAPRKPPRKNKYENRGSEKNRRKRYEYRGSEKTQKQKKKRYDNRCSGNNINKLYVNRGSKKKTEKLYENRSRCSEKQQKKPYVRTGAPATKNPDKTI